MGDIIGAMLLVLCLVVIPLTALAVVVVTVVGAYQLARNIIEGFVVEQVGGVARGDDDGRAARQRRLLSSMMPDEGDIVIETTVSEEVSRCPTCGTDVGHDDAMVCPACETRHHGDCWAYGGGCAIYGCSGVARSGVAAAAPVLHDAEAALARRLGRWYLALKVKWWTSMGFWASVALATGVLYSGALYGMVFPVLVMLPVVYLVLWLATSFLQGRLESSLVRTAQVPPDRAREFEATALASRSRPSLVAWAEAFPRFYVGVMSTQFVLAWLVSADVNPFVAMANAVMGLLPAWLVVYTARKHELRLEQVRWRLYATSSVMISNGAAPSPRSISP